MITGAAGGFGTKIIEALFKESYTVTGALRDSTGRNKAAAEALRQRGVFVVEIDITDDDSVETGLSKASSEMGV